MNDNNLTFKNEYYEIPTDLQVGDRILVNGYFGDDHIENKFAKVLYVEPSDEWDNFTDYLLVFEDWYEGHYYVPPGMDRTQCMHGKFGKCLWVIGHELEDDFGQLFIQKVEDFNYDDIFGPINESMSSSEKYALFNGAKVGDKFIVEVNCPDGIQPPTIAEIIAIRDEREFDDEDVVFKYLLSVANNIPCLHDGNLNYGEEHLSDKCAERRCWWVTPESGFRFYKIEKVQSINYDDIFGPINESNHSEGLQVKDLQVGRSYIFSFEWLGPYRKVDGDMGKVLISDGDWVLVAFKNFDQGHSSVSFYPEQPECDKNNCWWLSKYPNKYQNYVHVEALPDFNYFDVFDPTINESAEPKPPRIEPNLRIGDRVVVSFNYDDMFVVENKFARIIDIDNTQRLTQYLLLFDDWKKGHGGGVRSIPDCYINKCFWIYNNTDFRVLKMNKIADFNYFDVFDPTVNESAEPKPSYVFPDDLQVGDKVMVDLIGRKSGHSINGVAKVIKSKPYYQDRTYIMFLLAFDNWHNGHDGLEEDVITGCRTNNCWWLVNDPNRYEKLVVYKVSDFNYFDVFDPTINESAEPKKESIYPDNLQIGGKFIIEFLDVDGLKCKPSFAEIVAYDEGEDEMDFFDRTPYGYLFKINNFTGHSQGHPRCNKDCWWISPENDIDTVYEYLRIVPMEEMNYFDFFD